MAMKTATFSNKMGFCFLVPGQLGEGFEPVLRCSEASALPDLFPAGREGLAFWREGPWPFSVSVPTACGHYICTCPGISSLR